ncbi:DUF6537 domain-containing protein, partial [Steroidobacter sp.]|uniref:DUF6537 domain-containing protein n=1 Tax=Steroidobacter sp. TaxID=1978227 RepID=UPI001A51542A
NLYDMTGLSQKGGAVFSHVRLSKGPGRTVPARIGSHEAHLMLACDAVAATHKDAIQTIDADRTVVIVNRDVTATADFQSRGDMQLGIEPLLATLTSVSGERPPEALSAGQLATRFLGDAIATNMIMLGFAWQRGRLPLSRASLERAIALNGVAVPFNLRAFALGRLAAASPEALLPSVPSIDLDTFITRRADDLAAYQNAAYAANYVELLREVRQSEARLDPGAERLAWAVARSAFKLMAYKDEYEVARLYADGRFQAELTRQFEGDVRLQFHLAPPLLTRTDARTGRPRKITLGAWMLPVFRLLAHGKHLRQTPLDVFGWTAERRLERALRDTYLAWVRSACSQLNAGNYQTLAELAEAPLQVRGFGPVKAEAAHRLLQRIHSTTA